MSNWLDFNGDGKVDAGEQYVGYRIFEDVNSDSGLFSGRSAGSSLFEKVSDFLAYAIFLAPVFLVLLVFKWLSDLDALAGSICMLVVVLALLGWFVRFSVKQHREDRIRAEYEERAREIVDREVFTDEEIRNHARIWAVVHDQEWNWKYKRNIEACRDLIEQDYRKNRVWRVAEEK